MRHSLPHEGPFVCPALASVLSGFRPAEVRDLIAPCGCCGQPVVRSAHVDGRLGVHLVDLLALAAVATPVPPYEGGAER